MAPDPAVRLEAWPAVLVITDLPAILRVSVRTIRRQLARGTFPIRPMSGPEIASGLDRRYRWARLDVEAYVGGGFRSFDRRAIRRRIA